MEHWNMLIAGNLGAFKMYNYAHPQTDNPSCITKRIEDKTGSLRWFSGHCRCTIDQWNAINQFQSGHITSPRCPLLDSSFQPFYPALQ